MDFVSRKFEHEVTKVVSGANVPFLPNIHCDWPEDKGTEYTCKGGNSLRNNFASFAPEEDFLPFRVDPISKGTWCTEKPTMKVISLWHNCGKSPMCTHSTWRRDLLTSQHHGLVKYHIPHGLWSQGRSLVQGHLHSCSSLYCLHSSYWRQK